MAADEGFQGVGLMAVAAGPEMNLQVPKLTEEDPGVNIGKEAVDSIAKQLSFVCGECGKGFSSGKALGGHKSSAHIQFKERQKARSLVDGGSEDGKHVCGICLKEFPSSKSIYGHMRLHPEREWRGMDPMDRHREPDLTALVGSGWGKTGRRSQKFTVPIFEPGDFANEEEEEMTNQVARAMVSLANPEARLPGAGEIAATSVHQCEVCGKIYPTGQALGGHKRSHYVPPFSSEIGGDTSERSFPDLDLNGVSGDQD